MFRIFPRPANPNVNPDYVRRPFEESRLAKSERLISHGECKKNCERVLIYGAR